MAFGSLVPGMAPMPIPAMRENQMMKAGMGLLQQARQAQQPVPGAPGQPPQAPQGLLQRLLNPQAPPGAPMDLAAPGMPPGGPAPAPAQMGLLAKLFQGMGGAGGAPPMGGGSVPPVPPNLLGGLY